MRIAGSFLGLAAIASLFLGTTPLGVVADSFEWMGLSAASVTEPIHEWMVARSGVTTVVGTMLLAVGLLTTTWSGQGAAVAMVAMAALAEVGVTVVPVLIIVLISATTIAFILSRIRPNGMFGFHHAYVWALSCLGQLFGATVFIAAIPISKIAGAPPRGLQW